MVSAYMQPVAVSEHRPSDALAWTWRPCHVAGKMWVGPGQSVREEEKMLVEDSLKLSMPWNYWRRKRGHFFTLPVLDSITPFRGYREFAPFFGLPACGP